MPRPLDLDRLEQYFALFQDAFRRRDQARWAAVYMQGLLLDLPRKNVETIAHHVTLPPDLLVEDRTQALQNFINQSPWDENLLWRRYRTLMARRLARPEGIFVLDEIAIAKQGQHSVGVQRQYSGSVGEKINCQIAVAVHYVSAAGCCPLSLRLYLPAAWLNSASRLEIAGVPEDYRRRLSKSDVARTLLEELRAEGFQGGAVAASPAHSSTAQTNGAGSTEKTLLPGAPWERLQRELRALGLDHFEGRSWRGFHHHACLVALAYGFVVSERAAAPRDG